LSLYRYKFNYSMADAFETAGNTLYLPFWPESPEIFRPTMVTDSLKINKVNSAKIATIIWAILYKKWHERQWHFMQMNETLCSGVPKVFSRAFSRVRSVSLKCILIFLCCQLYQGRPRVILYQRISHWTALG
jgi:hypothetical protein